MSDSSPTPESQTLQAVILQFHHNSEWEVRVSLALALLPEIVSNKTNIAIPNYTNQPVGQNSTERIQLCSDIQISIHKLSLETDFLAHILLFVLQIKVEKNTLQINFATHKLAKLDV